MASWRRPAAASRTLAYAIVTGLLVGVYAGLVLLATQLFRFNPARYDAGKTGAAFAGRLKETVDLVSVRDNLAGVVHRTLEPAHVSVWVSHRD